MGWCSATYIFDAVCAALFEQEPDKEEILMAVISALEDGDWDCQQDSKYWDHPLVRKIFKKMNPSWFEDEVEDA